VESVAPFSIVALIVTVPGVAAVRVFPLIDAPVVPAFAMAQIMVLLVAPVGSTVPVRVRAVSTTAVEGTPLI
jgi:hypothetical protein